MSTKILILAANPKDTPRLRLDQEVREIESGLERKHNDDFLLKQRWAARPADVRRAMLDFHPNIVHFCGHGSGDDGIAFEDDMGQTRLVNAEALGGFFKLFSHDVECVFLNACYSEVQADGISKHIRYVIGMHKSVEDAIAIEFAIAFYDALVAGESVVFAFECASNSIKWNNLPESIMPILKCRSPESMEQEKTVSSRALTALAATGGGSIGLVAGSLLFGPLGGVVGAAIGGIIGCSLKKKKGTTSLEDDFRTDSDADSDSDNQQDNGDKSI